MLFTVNLDGANLLLELGGERVEDLFDLLVLLREVLGAVFRSKF